MSADPNMEKFSPVEEYWASLNSVARNLRPHVHGCCFNVPACIMRVGLPSEQASLKRVRGRSIRDMLDRGNGFNIGPFGISIMVLV